MAEASTPVTYSPGEEGRRVLAKYTTSDGDNIDTLIERALQVYDIVMTYQREGVQLLALQPGGTEVNRVRID